MGVPPRLVGKQGDGTGFQLFSSKRTKRKEGQNRQVCVEGRRQACWASMNTTLVDDAKAPRRPLSCWMTASVLVGAVIAGATILVVSLLRNAGAEEAPGVLFVWRDAGETYALLPVMRSCRCSAGHTAYSHCRARRAYPSTSTAFLSSLRTVATSGTVMILLALASFEAIGTARCLRT